MPLSYATDSIDAVYTDQDGNVTTLPVAPSYYLTATVTGAASAGTLDFYDETTNTDLTPGGVSLSTSGQATTPVSVTLGGDDILATYTDATGSTTSSSAGVMLGSDAYLTPFDIMGSPDAVGDTLLDAAGVYGPTGLGERDAINLAFNDTGTIEETQDLPVVSADVTFMLPTAAQFTVAQEEYPTSTLTSAYDLGTPPPLAVPNTLRAGLPGSTKLLSVDSDGAITVASDYGFPGSASSADPFYVDIGNQQVAVTNVTGPGDTTWTIVQSANAPSLDPGASVTLTFNVNAVAVEGTLPAYAGYPASAPAAFYAFNGTAGQLYSFQVLSNTNLLNPNPIQDPELLVIAPDGQVIGFNVHEFESADSTILDVTLPSNGTYYIGIDNVLNDLGIATPAVNYELFAYSFAEGGPTSAAGPSLYAGSGNDILVASGDTLIGGTGNDTLVGSSGNDNFQVNSAPGNHTVIIAGSGINQIAPTTSSYSFSPMNGGETAMSLSGPGASLSGVPVSFTAAITGSDQTFADANVTFVDETTDQTLGTTELTTVSDDGASIGDAVLANQVLPYGANVIEASYTDNGTTYTASFTEYVTDVTVTPGNSGDEYAATATVNGGSSLDGIGLTLDYEALNSSGSVVANLGSTAPTAAGNYEVTALFSGAGEYLPDSASATYTISSSSGKTPPTVSVVDASGTYNGNAFLAMATVNGGSTLEGVGLTLDYEELNTSGDVIADLGSTAPTSAGSYEVTASFAGSTDYAATSNSTTFTIAQATPTVSVSDAGGMYLGSTFPATATVKGVSGSAGSTLESVGLTLDYELLNASGGVVSDLGSTAPSTAGSYKVTASFAGSTDYAATSNSTTFTIGQAAITITANAASTTYGTSTDTASGLPAGYAITSGALASGDAITSVAYVNSDTLSASGYYDAGTYSITPSSASGTGGFNSTNYAVTYDNGALTVAQAAITITANAASTTYGTSTDTASGLPAGYAITTGALAAGDAITNVAYANDDTLSASGYYDAGTYSITPSSASGTGGFNSTNYAVTYDNGALSVAQAAITIKANAASTTYGTSTDTASGLPTGYAITTGALASGDAITNVAYANDDTLSASGYYDAGTYSITPSSASGTGGFNSTNYAITYDNGALTVAQAAITITANAENTTYGTSTDTASGLPTGYAITTGVLASGDAITNVSYANNDTLSASGYYDAGTYSITPSSASGTGGFNSTNYAITYATGTLSVAQAAITITANPESTTYGTSTDTASGLPAGYAITTGALASGDAVTSVAYVNSDTLSASGYYDAGTYSITPSSASGTGGFNSTNYAVTYDNGALTVAQAAITITANAASTTYGTSTDTASGLPAGYAITTGALAAGDAITNVAYANDDTLSASGYYDAGTYSITPSSASGTGGFNSTNYAITYDNGALTVAQAAITITANATSTTYGTSTDTASGLPTGYAITTGVLASGDAITNVSYANDDTLSASGYYDAGTYSITPSSASGTGGFNSTNYAITYDNGYADGGAGRHHHHG